MEPVPDNSTPCFPRRLQVETLHGILRDLLYPVAGGGDSDLSPSQRECSFHAESKCQRADSDRCLLLPDIRQSARRLCLLCNPAGRTTPGLARFAEQRVAALLMPAVFAPGVCS